MAAITPPALTPSTKNFVFINDSHPDESKSKRKRKLVRAQAARGPHPTLPEHYTPTNPPATVTVTRHNYLKQSKKKKGPPVIPLSIDGLDRPIPHTFPSLSLKPPVALKPAHLKGNGPVVSVVDKGLETAQQDFQKAEPAVYTPQKVQPLYGEAVEQIAGPLAVTHGCPPTTAQLPQLGYVTPPDSVALYSSSESPDDLRSYNGSPRAPVAGFGPPFEFSWASERPYISLLLNHYLYTMAIEFPEIDMGYKFSIRRRWFPMMMTSPATLFTTLLNAASHYTAIHNLHLTRHFQQILLDLKHLALSNLNAAISAHFSSSSSPKTTSPSSSCSSTHASPIPDPILGAIAKLASYEAMFGTPSLFHTHMRGLQHLVSERGGLDQLGLEGLLMRCIQVIDINSAFILRSRTYFRSRRPLATHTGHVNDGFGERQGDGRLGGGDAVLAEQQAMPGDGFGNYREAVEMQARERRKREVEGRWADEEGWDQVDDYVLEAPGWSAGIRGCGYTGK